MYNRDGTVRGYVVVTVILATISFLALAEAFGILDMINTWFQEAIRMVGM